MSFYTDFRQNLRQPALLPHLADQRIVVAVSGGADSLCLLHLMHRCAAAFRSSLVVATLDHGLRGSAGAEDAAYVTALATEWGLPVRTGKRDVATLAQTHHLSLEDAARRARYGFLFEVAREVGARCILTGHHADDQAETILLHLIRGSGMAGLRGMQPVSPLGPGHLLPDAAPPRDVVLVRPLLPFSRETIEAYCCEQGLQPREDATNAEISYARNRIRHEVLPLLETLNPGVRRVLVQTGAILSDDYTKLKGLAEDALAQATREQTPHTLHLDAAQFRAADVSLQRDMLRAAVRHLAKPDTEIGFATLEAARSVAMQGQTGQQATLPGGITLRLAYDLLILETPTAQPTSPDWPLLPPDTVLAVNVPGETTLPDSPWRLITRWLAPEEDPATYQGRAYTATLVIPEDAVLILRTRQPGDRFKPLGMAGHSQKLKETLINARVPAALRDTLPILTVNREIAWIIAGETCRIAEPFAIRKHSQKKLLLFCVHD